MLWSHCWQKRSYGRAMVLELRNKAVYFNSARSVTDLIVIFTGSLVVSNTDPNSFLEG